MPFDIFQIHSSPVTGLLICPPKKSLEQNGVQTQTNSLWKETINAHEKWKKAPGNLGYSYALSTTLYLQSMYMLHAHSPLAPDRRFILYPTSIVRFDCNPIANPSNTQPVWWEGIDSFVSTACPHSQLGYHLTMHQVYFATPCHIYCIYIYGTTAPTWRIIPGLASG